MSALSYLVRRQLRNAARDLLRHPGKLAVYLAAAAFFAFMAVSPQQRAAQTGRAADPRMLEGVYYGLLLLFCAPILFRSLKSGTTMFKMPDVNLLFVSPLPPKRILVYGLLKQTAATLLGFVFMLFYSGVLMRDFHISAWGVVWLLLGMVAVVMASQMLALLLYGWSNGNPKRQNAVRAALYVFFGAMALALLFQYTRNGGGAEGFLAALHSRWLEWFPLVGWAKGAAFALVGGNLAAALLWTALLAAAFALVLALFLRTDADYYEDVLQQTESAYELQQAVKEKRAVPANRGGGARKVRAGGSGIGRGWGASAFFYRQLREARRRSRLVLLGSSTAVVLAVDLAVFFMIGRGGDGPSPDMTLAVLLALDVYLLFLTSAAGDWTRELAKPYIYLVPDTPFRKLLWASMTTALKPVAEGAVFFAVLAAAARADAAVAVICFLAYASFGMLFLSGNILSERTLGSLSNRGLILFLFLFLLLLLAAPGIGAGVFLYTVLPGLSEPARLFLSGLPCVAWNLIASLLIFYLCRNILSNAEAS